MSLLGSRGKAGGSLYVSGKPRVQGYIMRPSLLEKKKMHIGAYFGWQFGKCRSQAIKKILSIHVGN